MRLFIIIAIHLFMSSVLFSANNYEWINCTEGLEGTYGLNLFIFENKIYDYTLNIVSNDTGKTWQANKYNITANDGNTYLIYLNFYNFFKYRNKYVGLGANNWLSNDMINWYSIGKFNGVPSGHSVTNIFATDSTFLIQTFSQNKYKTFLTKDTSNLIFHPIENDLPSNYKVLDYSYINDTLYATSASPFYIATYYYSTDGGVNWQHDSIANIVDPISYIKYLNNKYYIISRRHLWAQDDEGNWFECQSDSLIKPQERTILISYKDKIITNTEINDVNMLIASDDGGKTWRRFGTSNFYIKQLLAMGDKLIANTFNGIQISTDDGKTWVESNKGIFKSNLRAENQWHKFVSYNNEIMTASRNYMIDNTIMKSYDNGKTWVKKIIDPSFIEEKNKRRISDFRYFVVGTDLGVFALNYYDAVYKTNDFGGNLGEVFR